MFGLPSRFVHVTPRLRPRGTVKLLEDVVVSLESLSISSLPVLRVVQQRFMLDR